MRIPSRRDRRLGAAAVEFAMVSPLLAVLILGTIEVSGLVETHHVLSTASSAAAREVAAGTTDPEVLKQAVADRLAAFGFHSPNVRITVTDETGLANGPTTLTRAKPKRVRVALTLNSFRNGLKPMVVLDEAIVAVTETVVWTAQPRD